MRGKILIIQDFAGSYHIRRLWDATTEKAYITDEAGLSRIPAGQDLDAIGFPWQDVFEYDEEAAAAISLGRLYDWSRLPNWKP